MAKDAKVKDAKATKAKPVKDKEPPSSSKVWTIFSLVAALGGGTIAKKGLNKSWTAATGKNPPANPADPDVDLWEAVMWAAVSGTVVALARMLATRRAANYYQRSTGYLPPDLRKDDQDAGKAKTTTT